MYELQTVALIGEVVIYTVADDNTSLLYHLSQSFVCVVENPKTLTHAIFDRRLKFGYNYH